MKIEVRKISQEPKKFSLNLKDLDFDLNINGSIAKMKNSLLKIEANICGKISLICDKSGEEYIKDIDSNLTLFASSGIWNSNHIDENFDVIEFFDDYIDLDSIFLSEVESIKLEYHSKED